MPRYAVRCVAATATVLLIFGSATSLADAPCTADQPRLATEFSQLAAMLGTRVGDARECERTSETSVDLQQLTTTGLLYLRRSTNTPTFTDGGTHWALREGQLLEWATDDVDPPASARHIASTPGPTVPTPAVGTVASAAEARAAPDITRFLLAGSISVVLLAMAVALGTTILRLGSHASGRGYMSRWASRLLLVVWPGGLIAYRALEAPYRLPSTPDDALVDVWVVAVVLEVVLGFVEALSRRQTIWVIAQLLPVFGSVLYILVAAQSCGGCQGSGRQRGDRCPACNGTGTRSTGRLRPVETPLGMLAAQQGHPAAMEYARCSSCRGSGRLDLGACPRCGGTGQRAGWF